MESCIRKELISKAILKNRIFPPQFPAKHPVFEHSFFPLKHEPRAIWFIWFRWRFFFGIFTVWLDLLHTIVPRRIVAVSTVAVHLELRWTPNKLVLCSAFQIEFMCNVHWALMFYRYPTLKSPPSLTPLCPGLLRGHVWGWGGGFYTGRVCGIFSPKRSQELMDSMMECCFISTIGSPLFDLMACPPDL